METRPYNYLVHVLPWVQHPNSERASCKLFPFQKNGLILCCTSEAIFTHIYRLSISKGTIENVVVDYANDLPVGRLLSQARYRWKPKILYICGSTYEILSFSEQY